MALNPTGTTSYNWNYSKPEKAGYSTTLVGTVVAIQEIQKMSFSMNGQPGAPEFWADGNPKMNIRLALATESGELKTFTFQPAGKQQRMGNKPSVHMDLFKLTGNTDMMNLIGKTISITTQEGHYGQGNPRPWNVALVEAGPYALNIELPSEFKAPQVLANTAVSGGQMQTPMMQQQPMVQQSIAQQPTQQQWQPQVQQPMQRPVQQQTPQGYPQGMSPSVANAMQQAGIPPQNIEVIQQASPAVGNIYNDEIPF